MIFAKFGSSWGPGFESGVVKFVHSVHTGSISPIDINLATQDHPQFAQRVLLLQLLANDLRSADNPSPEQGTVGGYKRLTMGHYSLY